VKVLVTGSSGFIGGYVVNELLKNGYKVTGIDNYSKYGKIDKSHDTHPNFTFINCDAKDTDVLTNLLIDCDHFIALAASIGGISYFHEYSYDLISENMKLMAASFDAAVKRYTSPKNKLKKITVLSSSMIYESTDIWPSKEDDEFKIPPPFSTYGFSKLAVHYFAKGAFDQYKLPYTIINPFNCVGIGEEKAIGESRVMDGNIQLAMSHVIPDLCQKVLKGQYPLHILGNGKQIRHYTYGGDLAKAIMLSLENENAINESFNISTNKGHTVYELAKLIWKKAKIDKPFKVKYMSGFRYDVQKRVPDTSKAKKLLGFEATTKLEDVLDEIILWISDRIKAGKI